MIYCAFVSQICTCKLRNAIHISSDFPTGFHWVSKCMHVDVVYVHGLGTVIHELLMSLRSLFLARNADQ